MNASLLAWPDLACVYKNMDSNVHPVTRNLIFLIVMNVLCALATRHCNHLVPGLGGNLLVFFI